MAQRIQTWPNTPAVATETPWRTQRVWRLYALGVAAYAALFALWQAEPVPWEVYTASVVLWAVCLLPLARWFRQGKRTLPMFELIGVAYGLQFAMPVFLQASEIQTVYGVLSVRWDVVLEALLLALTGVLALLAGYYVLPRWDLVRHLPRLDLPLRPERRSLYISMAVGLGVTALSLQTLGALQVDSTFGAIFGVLTNQFRVGVALLAYYVYGTPQRRLAPTAALYAALVIAVALGLLSGMLENALIPLVVLMLVRWQMSGRFPVGLVLIGFVGFVVLNAVKSDYRSQAWYSSTPLDPGERLSLWADLGQTVVTDTASGDTLRNAGDLVRGSMARFDLIHKFAYVREMTPRYLPYYEGITYQYMLISWIPRVVWPDKPVASESNQIVDVDYGLKFPQQTSTNIGIGQLPEAYVNFGVAGIVVVMFLQGLVFGLINHLYNGPRSDGGRAIYVSIMVFFLNGIGSSTAIWFGALAQNLLANTLILRVFSSPYRAQDSDVHQAQAKA